MAQVSLNWKHSGIRYTNLREVIDSHSDTQGAAIKQKIIKIGRTPFLAPRECGRIGSYTGLTKHFPSVVVELIEFAQQFEQTATSVPFQAALRKLIFISEGIQEATTVKGKRKFQTEAVISTIYSARKIIGLAIDLHPDEERRMDIEDRCGSFMDIRTLSLFMDIAAMAADWDFQALYPTVEFARIFTEWEFPVNQRYCWLPLDNEYDSRKISSYFIKNVMLD